MSEIEAEIEAAGAEIVPGEKPAEGRHSGIFPDDVKSGDVQDENTGEENEQ